MARYRDSKPPLEIMRSIGAGASSTGAHGAERGQSAESEGENGAMMEDAGHPLWWGAGMPVVLRLPRGVAALLMVGLLLLIVLAYWVGYMQGRGSSETSSGEATTMRAKAPPLRSHLPNDRETQAIGGKDVTRQTLGMPRAQQTREPGLNYLFLARYRKENAQGLARWMAAHGEQTVVVPSARHDLYQVIALRGFTSEQFAAGKFHEYEDHMRQLGRQWRASNGGEGDDLGSMYWKRYNGED